MITEITDGSRVCLVPEEYNTFNGGTFYICAGLDFGAEVLDRVSHFFDAGLDFGTEVLDSVLHFFDEGYCEAKDLYRASLVDEEMAVEGTGYYCKDCLEKMGFSTEGRETVAKRLEAKPRTGRLRICQTPHCYSPADWDDLIADKWFCGPCVAVEVVNRFAVEGRLDELFIRQVFPKITPRR